MEIKRSKNPDVCFVLTKGYVRARGYADEREIIYTQIPEVTKDWLEPMKTEMMQIYNERFPLIECEVCGKKFNKMNRTVVCSPECSHKRHNERQAKRNREMVESYCVICGKKFIKRRYQQKYVCSVECGKEYRKEHEVKIDCTPKKKKKNSLAEAEKAAREKGLHYADIQKQETLAMVGRVEI